MDFWQFIGLLGTLCSVVSLGMVYTLKSKIDNIISTDSFYAEIFDQELRHLQMTINTQADLNELFADSFDCFNKLRKAHNSINAKLNSNPDTNIILWELRNLGLNNWSQKLYLLLIQIEIETIGLQIASGQIPNRTLQKKLEEKKELLRETLANSFYVD